MQEIRRIDFFNLGSRSCSIWLTLREEHKPAFSVDIIGIMLKEYLEIKARRVRLLQARISSKDK